MAISNDSYTMIRQLEQKIVKETFEIIEFHPY